MTRTKPCRTGSEAGGRCHTRCTPVTVTVNDCVAEAPSGSVAVAVTSAAPGARPVTVSVSPSTETAATAGFEDSAAKSSSSPSGSVKRADRSTSAEPPALSFSVPIASTASGAALRDSPEPPPDGEVLPEWPRTASCRTRVREETRHGPALLRGLDLKLFARLQPAVPSEILRGRRRSVERGDAIALGNIEHHPVRRVRLPRQCRRRTR